METPMNIVGLAASFLWAYLQDSLFLLDELP
jgi:hypothetical protein